MTTGKPIAEKDDELAVLCRIERMVTALAKAALATQMAEIQSDPQLLLVYENAGKLPRPALEKRTKFSGGKISGLWKQWEAKGLMVKDGKSYRPLF